MESFPIAYGDEHSQVTADKHVEALESIVRERHAAQRALRDWFAVTWELPKPHHRSLRRKPTA
jgi:hypothetical protein